MLEVRNDECNPMALSIFAYGTLEIPQVLEAVTGRSFPSTIAVLPDYARFLLEDEIYPGILPDPRSEVRGVLYEGVDRDSLLRLDRFEGVRYRRESVRVTTPSRRRIDAHAYVVRPEHRWRLSSRPWDPDAFVSLHLADFLPGCREIPEGRANRPESDPDPRAR